MEVDGCKSVLDGDSIGVEDHWSKRSGLELP